MPFPPRDTPTPDPLYPCSAPGCADNHTWPADDLFYAGTHGWLCVECAEELEVVIGVSLAEFLEASEAR